MNDPQSAFEGKVWEGDVVVIGGGWSGMLVAKHCKQQGLNVRILEKNPYHGGVWKYVEGTNGGVMKSTQTTSSWSFTEISDFPLLEEDGLNTDFPKHDVVQDYLERYSKHNGLPKITSFECCAEAVTKEDGMFVTIGTDGNTYISKRLAVCTGFQGSPRSSGFEKYTKDYTGTVLHANTYKYANELHENKTILVIGGGETASDLTNEISYVTKKCYLSIPNGQWFGGRFNQHWAYNEAWPLDNFSSRMRRSILDGNPEPEKFEAMKVWAEKFDGAFGHGFKCWESPYEVYGQAIINKSNDVLRRCVLGRVDPKGKMDHIEGKDVYFKDGSVAKDVDIIYFATGYRMEFPFLKGIGKENQCVSTLYKLCMDCEDESIAFVGFSRPIRGSFPSISESMGRYLGYAWSGKCKILPPHERERIRRIDKNVRDLFFTAFDKYGYTKACPSGNGGVARANSRAAGLQDLFGFTDEMAKLDGVSMPNYTRILFECGIKKWLIAVLSPHHQGQYMLNDKSKREYVFGRFEYFLTRFPIFMPIIFSLFLGLFHYVKSYIRNRYFWTIGFLFVRKPHPNAIHIFKYKRDLARERNALCFENALIDEWPVQKNTCTTNACGTSSCGN